MLFNLEGVQTFKNADNSQQSCLTQGQVKPGAPLAQRGERWQWSWAGIYQSVFAAAQKAVCYADTVHSQQLTRKVVGPATQRRKALNTKLENQLEPAWGTLSPAGFLTAGSVTPAADVLFLGDGH